MFPESPTTYKLPFDTKVRVGSRRRFVLVREDAEGKPSVIGRSDSRLTLERDYNGDSDYIIDQVAGRVYFTFNRHEEVSDAHTGKCLGRTPFEVSHG